MSGPPDFIIFGVKLYLKLLLLEIAINTVLKNAQCTFKNELSLAVKSFNYLNNP